METTRAAFAWTGVPDEKIPVLEKYEINTLYIDYQSYRNVPGYRCFLLAGRIGWGQKEMNKMIGLAQTKEAGGVVFDIEENYTALADDLEAIESPIPVYACIPWWLDEETAERIIMATDGVIVMNYSVGNEKENLEEETKFCRKHKKELITAYELQPVAHNVPEGITYEGDVAAALESYGKLEGVGLALHWLNFME